MSTPRQIALLASLTAKLMLAGLATCFAQVRNAQTWKPLFCESTTKTGPQYTPRTLQPFATHVMADCGTPEATRALTITDAELLSFWRLAADDATQHRASVCGGCGDSRGRCQHRRSAIVECDGYLDQWLARHGRPT